MQSLAAILKTLEQLSGAPFSDFETVEFFHSQSIFDVAEAVGAQGDAPWIAVDIDTGEVTRDVNYEPGVSWFYDSVLFFINNTLDCMLLHLPEAGVSIQFARSEQAALLGGDKGSALRQYHSDLDFAKLGERNISWTRFVNDWKALPETLK